MKKIKEVKKYCERNRNNCTWWINPCCKIRFITLSLYRRLFNFSGEWTIVGSRVAGCCLVKGIFCIDKDILFIFNMQYAAYSWNQFMGPQTLIVKKWLLFYSIELVQSDKSPSGGHVFYNFELYCTTRTITLVNLKRAVAYCIRESQFNSLKKKKVLGKIRLYINWSIVE